MIARASCLDEVERNGFAVVPHVINEETSEELIALMARADAGYGKRNVLSELEEVRAVAQDPVVRSIVESVLGTNAFAVRGLFFDKTPDANWKVTWHQDRFIAVPKRLDIPGFTAWSIKDGVPHVQPPLAILEAMVTIRIHLDDCDESNGALMVLPGSHSLGFLDATQIRDWRERVSPLACAVPRGGAVLMRPLLLHASSKAKRPSHRRVLHLEFAAASLPGGLEWAFRE